MFSGPHKIIKNTVFLYGKSIITALITLFSVRLVVNSLGPSEYGVYGIVGGVIAMMAYVNVALSQSTLRFINYVEGTGTKDGVSRVFNNSIIIHLAIGLLVLAVMGILYWPLFNGVLNIPDASVQSAKSVYWFLAISSIFTIIAAPYDALINVHEDFLYYSIIGIVESILKLLAAVLLIFIAEDMRLFTYGLSLALISVFSTVIMRIFCRIRYSECKLKLRKYVSLVLLKEITAFSGWNFIGVFSNVTGNYGSTILMNHFYGSTHIAAKNIGDQICAQLNVLTSNLVKAINPSIIKYEGAGSRTKMLTYSLSSCKLGTCLYLILAVPFLTESEWILKMWLINVPEWTVLFCSLQVIRTFLEQLTNPLRTSLMAEGTIKWLNLSDFLLSILTFMILFILYREGFQAYWHYIISIMFMVIIESVVKIALCKKIMGLPIRAFVLNVLLNVTITSALSFSLSMLFKLLFSCEILVIFLSVAVTALFIFYIGLNSQERQYVKSIYEKRKRLR